VAGGEVTKAAGNWIESKQSMLSQILLMDRESIVNLLVVLPLTVPQLPRKAATLFDDPIPF
jgi:hypothetical protein